MLIKRLQRTVLSGGLFAVAVERGFGKTSLCLAAILWALLYGHHNYVACFAATDEKFEAEIFEIIKLQLESSDLLLADFPAVCWPIRMLEGTPQRARKQTLDGQPTRIRWKGSRRIMLPTVPGSPCSGAIFYGGGLKSGIIRGALFQIEGRLQRPGLVLLDDPQTDESAASVDACNKRERLIKGAVLGLAGPGEKLSALMSCTIIEPGDLADRLTDRSRSPEWRGVRKGIFKAWPLNLEKWDEWWDIVRRRFLGDEDLDADPVDDPCPEATEFIRENYAELHAGAEVSWEHRKEPWMLSAVHQAMWLYYTRGPLVFWSEYLNWQPGLNAPDDPLTQDSPKLDERAVRIKFSGYPRRCFPAEVQWLTAGIDCHDRVLTWLVCAWAADCTGYVIDYGTYPATRRPTWSVRTFRPTLREVFPGKGLEGALYAGLEQLVTELLGRELRRDDGAVLQIERCLVDCGYQEHVIKQFVRESVHRRHLLPSRGRWLGPSDFPMAQYRARPGELLGENLVVKLPTKGARRGVREVQFEANLWRTHAAKRLITPFGDPGCVSLYGLKDSRQPHDLLARHLCSELPKPTSAERTIDVWKLRPGESENHWWDNFIQCCIAASLCGARVTGRRQVTARRQRTVKF
jgi:hypothetical protein